MFTITFYGLLGVGELVANSKMDHRKALLVSNIRYIGSNNTLECEVYLDCGGRQLFGIRFCIACGSLYFSY